MSRLLNIFCPKWKQRPDMMLELGCKHPKDHLGSCAAQDMQKCNGFKYKVNRVRLARHRTFANYEAHNRKYAKIEWNGRGCRGLKPMSYRPLFSKRHPTLTLP